MTEKCHLFFETLGTGLKIRIITTLKEKALSVNELSKQLGQERSKCSHALKSLWKCGFVTVKNKGRERIYSLNTDTMIPLLDIVEKHIQKYCLVCKKERRMKK
ncbi:winged helix-turn-helix transcriptional regulator [Candidatus Woesearchaeota archaeon]|nr:winged helix-turn-helix transcriptional regulator [Candidatus Woesearchaeota archaeon]